MTDDMTQVMAPGILVAVRTSVTGGVQYSRQVLEEDDDGTVKRWETTRTMEDPEERKGANAVAGKAWTIVAKPCVRTSFGLLCRAEREDELNAAIVEVREMAREWNRKATHSFVNASVIKGRIADNDEEAVRAIVAEARDLLDRMDKGLADADVKVIRDAAMRAKKLSEMMLDDSSDRVTAAIAAARDAARSIVKRGAAIGDKVQNAVIEAQRDTFAEARFAFLETTKEATGEALPSVDVQRAAELEVAS